MRRKEETASNNTFALFPCHAAAVYREINKPANTAWRYYTYLHTVRSTTEKGSATTNVRNFSNTNFPTLRTKFNYFHRDTVFPLAVPGAEVPRVSFFKRGNKILDRIPGMSAIHSARGISDLRACVADHTRRVARSRAISFATRLANSLKGMRCSLCDARSPFLFPFVLPERREDRE